MTLDNGKDLKEVSNGDKELEKVAKKIVTLSREEELAGIYIKEDQDEWIRDRYKEEGLKKGREEGSLSKQKEIALNMQKEGMDIELIAKITEFTLDELKELL